MTTLVLPDSMASKLRHLTQLKVETGAVLLARPVESGQELRLLGMELLQVPEESYQRRRAQELLITSDGYVPALSRAEQIGAIPIWLHTHPGDGASPHSSRRDKIVDEQLNDVFRLRSGSPYYGAVVVAHEGGALRFSGHLATEDSRREIDRLWTVGPRFALTWNLDERKIPLPTRLDRNIRAFGGSVQRVLSDLRISVVGCGGTGSAVAEQLVRLGARHLLLVDPDDLTESNVTRVYGSRLADVGRKKVEVLAEHLRSIFDEIEIEVLDSKVTVEATARRLTAADVVFGCTDDNAGRLVLSRLATYFLVPVVDCGVLLTSDSSGRLDGIHGRVTLMYPGAACLVCRDRIDLGRAGAEMLTPEERTQRVDEGYAPALPGIEPAVVTYTTFVAACAVSELIERLTSYGPEPAPSEVILRVHDREVSTNEEEPRERHYCHPLSGKLGIGMTEPFLEQTWAA